MTTAKVIEICSESGQSFEDAIAKGIETASESVHNIRGAWIQEQKVEIENNKISGYRVNMKITFVLD